MTIEQKNGDSMPTYEQQRQFFDDVIQHLKQLHKLIRTTTYVKRSAQILNIIIDDTTQPKKVLVLSRDSEWQAAFINAQLNRSLMPLLFERDTMSTSIIRYGGQERLDAHFLDGQVASFELDHLTFFTSMESEGAHLLQEGLDYVDIFLNEALLQNVSLIDVPAISKQHEIFIQPGILRRADDIYWLLEDAVLTASEKRLLKRLSKMGFAPLAISKHALAIADDSPFRATLIEADTVAIQAALIAHERYNKAHIAKLADRLLQWLERFHMEISNLLQRDPYLEARQQLEHEIAQLEHRPSHDNEEFEALKQYANRLVVHYEKAQTLYQVAQFIKQHSFIKQTELVAFVATSNDYLESLHVYRRAQQHYYDVNVELETLERKSRSKLMLNLFTKEHKERLQRIGDELPIIREQLLDAYKRTKRYEEAVKEALPTIAPLLQQAVNDELADVDRRVKAIDNTIPTGPTKRFKAIHRLKRFDGLCEAQTYLNDFLPTVVPMMQHYLDAKQQLRLQAGIVNIAALTLDYQQVIEEAQRLPETIVNDYVLTKTTVELLPLVVERLQLDVEKPNI